MTFHNPTPLQDALAIGMGPDRETHVGVVLKGTFQIPDGLDGEAGPADEPWPIAEADEFFDGDVAGSVRVEAECYVYKPRADVLVVGSAHAPAGHTATALPVALRVGAHEWALRVTGDRRWVFPTRAMLVPIASDPEPFERMPLTWERAFGGTDSRARARSAENPVGRGLIGSKTRESVDGTPLPNVEHPRSLVASWDDAPPPAGFAPVRKDWAPRAALAGDAEGPRHPVFGLPDDFDFGWYNGAPAALQVPFLRGDEVVEMQHLTPERYRRFRLPGWRPRLTLGLFTDGRTWPEVLAAAPDEPPARPTVGERLEVRLDTLALYPDDGVLTLTWRANRRVAGPELHEVAGYEVALEPAGA